MKVKKLLLILAIITVINAVFTINSYAAKGTVTGKTVRVRESASTEAEIVTNVYKDDKVTVIEKSGDWYKIKYEKFEGYVHSDYLKVDEKVTSNTTNENSKTDTDNNETKKGNKETPISSTTVSAIKVGDNCKLNKDANLYIIPVLYASVIESLNSGDTVKVIQVVNNWVYVETKKYTGWIVKSAIEKTTETAQPEQNEPTQEPEKEQADNQGTEHKEPEKTTEPEPKEPSSNKTEDTNKKIGYVNVEQANIREGPSTDYEHVITAKLNQELNILDKQGNWYKVELKGVTGYISQKLVSDEKVDVTTSRGMTESRDSSTNQKEEIKQENKTEESKENNATVEVTKEESTEVKEEANKEETSTTKGSDIVAYAKKFLGGKYVSGGNTPETGMDCSGYTKYVFAHFGYSLSRTTSGQAKNGTEVAKSEMQEGDIIIFLDDSKKKIGHVGIYIGNNQFIHAANAKRGIVIDSVDNSYYKPRFVCVRRII